jgi:L-lactate dehydrogenase complex protein LldG
MENLFDTFKAKAAIASAEVHRFADRPAALGFLLELLRAEGALEGPPGSALWADRGFLAGPDRERLAAQAPGLSFQVTREAAAAAKVGISAADWGIADTGTLVFDAAPVEQRLVSTLPPIHVAFAATGRILPDLASALERMDPSRSGYISFITGPSRTADIERVLTIGVHGPFRLVVLFVDAFEGGL